MQQAALKPSPIAVRKRHPLIGAEIAGVDLSRPLDEATRQAIYDAWLDHLLLVFPNQPITDAQQIAFARRFGELEIHPSKDHRSTRHPEIYRVANVDEQGNILPPEGEAWRYLNITWLWHSDSSFRAIPSNGSILHGIEVTGAGKGGETLFCNLYAVYDALPEETKRRIEGLRVVHSHDAVLRRGQGIAKSAKYEDIPEVEQPLVRRHPVTRRKSLFISPHTMDRVVGLSAEEGRKLLDELTEFATQDRFVYRHTWAKDDVIMWDNRCTMHAVTPYDNASVRRIMHRTTLVGDGPVLAA
jgi:alpha-ketoglutarate-dependent taurine dioxygenase